MAEDALKKKAKELGIDIKVETNGSEGIKHRLTAEDIEKLLYSTQKVLLILAMKKLLLVQSDNKSTKT